MNLDEDTLQIRRIYEGRIFRVEQGLVRLPNGKETCRDVVKHPGAVAVLAWPSPRDIILVRQFRYATDRQLWEIPAGKLESNEDPATVLPGSWLKKQDTIPSNWNTSIRFIPAQGLVQNYCICLVPQI